MPGELLSLSSIYSDQPRKVCGLWGCELNESHREEKFNVGQDDYLIHLLSLWTITLGVTNNETHEIAVESEQTQDQLVTIASLQPSQLTMVNVCGLEMIPPVTIFLRTGSGPVYLSGLHVTLEGVQEENGQQILFHPPS